MEEKVEKTVAKYQRRRLGKGGQRLSGRSVFLMDARSIGRIAEDGGKCGLGQCCVRKESLGGRDRLFECG